MACMTTVFADAIHRHVYAELQNSVQFTVRYVHISLRLFWTLNYVFSF